MLTSHMEEKYNIVEYHEKAKSSNYSHGWRRRNQDQKHRPDHQQDHRRLPRFKKRHTHTDTGSTQKVK